MYEEEIVPEMPGDLQQAISKWIDAIWMACQELGTGHHSCELTFQIMRGSSLSPVGCKLSLLASVRRYSPDGKFSSFNWGQTYENVKRAPEMLEKELRLFLRGRLRDLEDTCEEISVNIKS